MTNSKQYLYRFEIYKMLLSQRLSLQSDAVINASRFSKISLGSRFPLERQSSLTLVFLRIFSATSECEARRYVYCLRPFRETLSRLTRCENMGRARILHVLQNAKARARARVQREERARKRFRGARPLVNIRAALLPVPYSTIHLQDTVGRCVCDASLSTRCASLGSIACAKHRPRRTREHQHY